MARFARPFNLLALLPLVCLFWTAHCTAEEALSRRPSSSTGGLCARLLLPSGYPCTEHTVGDFQKKKSVKMWMMEAVDSKECRSSSHEEEGMMPTLEAQQGTHKLPNGLALHEDVIQGYFDSNKGWFPSGYSTYTLWEKSFNCEIRSSSFPSTWPFSDQGFDVWVGNVRGTRWSHGHSTLSIHQRAFWDWSWQELAQYDLVEMITYVYTETNSKILFVGHSQGTIMALAAFSTPAIVDMIEAAALLCPISYLDHASAPLVLRAVSMHLDQMLLTLGLHQLNFRSETGVQLLDYLCDGHMDCSNILSSITGVNCCFNASRVEYYLEYEPHPSSTKNLNHLFQMIRKGTFAKYDYGWLSNLKRYGRLRPPSYDLDDIPESLPLWFGYGGADALADVTDVERTIKGLRSEPQLLYINSYGHIDFIMSVNAKDDVYDKLIMFFRSLEGPVSY